jgi:hypothetical protein
VRFYKEKKGKNCTRKQAQQKPPKRLREPLGNKKTKKRDLNKGGKKSVCPQIS